MYSRNDVVNAILCLEGWTLEPTSDGDSMYVYMNYGQITFNVIRNGEWFYRYVHKVNSIDEFYEIVVKAQNVSL